MMTKIRTYQMADIHTLTREIAYLANEKAGRNWLAVQTVVQVERVRDTVEASLLQVPDSAKGDNDWVLTERWVDWDKGGEVMGATRIIASTAHVSHEQLHDVMRSWMWGQDYMMDFGPSHCDLGNNPGCDYVTSDDEWYRKVLIPEYRRRYLG